MKRAMRAFLAVVLAVGCLFLSGCQDIAGIVGNVSKVMQAEGRKYGQAYEAQQNEPLRSEFFTYSVKAAEIVSELPNGSTAENGDDRILVVEIEVLNIFDEEIPMSNADFQIQFEGMTEAYNSMPLEEGYLDSQLEDNWEMPKDATKTGTLLFIVPAGVTAFGLRYLEIWDDDFEGNTYTVHFTAEDSTGAVA